MAEFTLGLTKTAVDGTLSRVKSAIEEETKLKVQVKNDLEFITSEFEMIRSFLDAANTEERAKNQVAQMWVRQLRRLAFDVEDCVEDAVNLDTNKSGWWRRLVPSCIAPPLPLDLVVAEIQQLKARVEHVSQRNMRYNLFSSNNGQSQSTTVAPAPAPASSSTTFSILSKVWEDSWKHRSTGDLKHLITAEGTDLQVISLWASHSTAAGAADHVGATSSSSYILRKAYNDPEVCGEFKIRVWVKLMHPFNPVEFINTLLAQFYINFHQPIIGADLSKKMKAAASAMENDELMQQVNKQRYLVVLEEVSAVVEWDAIKMYLPDSNNGSRVIVSTQHLGIALMCTGNPYQVSQLTRFSDRQLICAFSKQMSFRPKP